MRIPSVKKSMRALTTELACGGVMLQDQTIAALLKD
jgi:hypothetical protein